MSRTNPYTPCQLCGNLHLYDEMTNVPLRDGEGKLIYALFCQNCMKPILTYIQGLPKFAHLDIRELLHLSITITLALIAILVGAIIGHVLGIFLALAGVLSGAASLAVLAVKRTTT